MRALVLATVMCLSFAARADEATQPKLKLTANPPPQEAVPAAADPATAPVAMETGFEPLGTGAPAPLPEHPAVVKAAETDAGNASALAVGPMQLALADGDLGLIRRTEARTEAGLAVRPSLIVDTPGLYGMIAVQTDVFGSYQLNHRTEVFGALTALQYRWVQDATLTHDQYGLGHSSVGASWLALPDGAAKVALFGRLHLPTSFEYRNAWYLGFEPGVSASGQPLSTVGWHAGLSVPLLATPSAAGAHPQALVSAVGGGSWTPKSWLSVVAELGARAGPLDAFEQLTAGIGGRFRIKQVGLELNAALPLAGASRYTGGVALRGSYRF